MSTYTLLAVEHTPIKIHFTAKNVWTFVQYLKNRINLKDYPECSLMMHALYDFGNTATVLYDGPMYLALTLDNPISTAHPMLEVEWASWTKDSNVAINYLKHSDKKYKYVISRKGIAIDPMMVKEFAERTLEHYSMTGFSTYDSSLSKEVIAPLKGSELYNATLLE